MVIQAKEAYVGSYLVEDPEGDAITFEILDDDGLDIELEAKESYTGLYQMLFSLQTMVIQMDTQGTTTMFTLSTTRR